MHSALVPPGALHHRVTAALANWQLDDAEELLAGVDLDPSPYAAAEPVADASDDPADVPASLGRAWGDTLRAELLVRRLRVAGFTLVGEPVSPGPNEVPAPALDLHAGVAELIDSGTAATTDDGDPRAESASRAALAIALVRSAKAAFDASDDDVQRAAGLARHARIELLSKRIDAAMDEAVEAASLLDPALPPSALMVDTLGALAGVLADLELMPLALDCLAEATETLTETEVKRAKAQLKVSLLTGLESSSARAEQIARQHMAFGRTIPREEIIAKVDAITVADARQAGRRMLATRPTVAAIGPIGKVLTPDQVVDRLGLGAEV